MLLREICHLFQEELRIKLQPLQEKLKTFKKTKLTCDKTAKHIKVSPSLCYTTNICTTVNHVK